MNEPATIDRLIDQWLDGSIDEPGMDRLNAWVKASPENADHFAQRSHLHSRLFDWAAARNAKGIPCPRKAPRMLTVLGMASAGLVSLALVALLVWQPTPGPAVAALSASALGILRYEGKPQEANDPTIRTGRYELERGLSSFRFENGVEVVIEGPADFEIESGSELNLSRGKLSATVPPEGMGFTVVTPTAEVIDFGTEFAIEVAPDKSSEVHVFEGAVDVRPTRAPETMPVRLETNGATRIAYESPVPMGIQLDPDRFLRSLDEPELRHHTLVRSMSPILNYRMGLKTFDGTSLQIHSPKATRSYLAPGKIGASLHLGGPAEESYGWTNDVPQLHSGRLSGICWVYLESRPRRASLASTGTLEEMGSFAWELWRDLGLQTCRLRTEDGELIELHGGEPLPIGKWQQLAFVADGETLRLYRNGSEVAATPCGPLSHTLLGPLVIGARRTESGQARHFWHGRIDEFALFDQALTGNQIQTLFEIAQTPPKR